MCGARAKTYTEASLGFPWPCLVRLVGLPSLRKRGSSRNFGRPEHAPRSSAGARTRLVVSRAPPTSPATESARNDPWPSEKSLKMCRTDAFCAYICKVAVRDEVDLKFSGCRKLKRGSMIIMRLFYILFMRRSTSVCWITGWSSTTCVFFNIVRANVFMIVQLVCVFCRVLHSYEIPKEPRLLQRPDFEELVLLYCCCVVLILYR